MSGVARPVNRSATGGAVYQFSIAGTLGPLTRAALSGMDTLVIPRSTVLTGTCAGPDVLHRLLTALDTNGFPPSRVCVVPAPARPDCSAITDPSTTSAKGAAST